MLFIVLMLGVAKGTHEDKYDSEAVLTALATAKTNGNYVNTGAGEDILYGGNDADTLFGGEGSDLFMLGLGDKYRPDTTESGLVTAACESVQDFYPVKMTGGHAGIDISVAGQVTTNSNFGGNAWNHSAWTETIAAKALRFQCQSGGHQMIGFNFQQPGASDSYSQLEYSIYCHGNNFRVYQSGQHVYNGASYTYSNVSPVMMLSVNEDNFVEYYFDGNLRYTSSTRIPDGQTYHIAIAVHHAGYPVTNMEYALEAADECTISSDTTSVDGSSVDEMIAIFNSGKTVLNAQAQDLEDVVEHVEDTACAALSDEYDTLLATRIGELSAVISQLQDMRDNPPDCPHM